MPNALAQMQMDHGYRAMQPGYSEYASNALAALFPTGVHALEASGIPLVSDAASAAIGVDEARKGNYLSAILSGLGVLPFVPGMTRAIDLPWDVGRFSTRPSGVDTHTFEVWENPSDAEIRKMMRKEAELRRGEAFAEDPYLRFLEDPDTGNKYIWGGDNALHLPVAGALGVKWPGEQHRGMIFRDSE